MTREVHKVRPDQVIDSQARNQHGAFTREQAHRAGLSDHAIDHRLGVGRWVRLAPGVYAAASSIPTWERQLTAALLSRPGSIVAGSSAAFLHRFNGYLPGAPTIMGPSTANGRMVIGRLIRVRDFESIQRTTVVGFPTTTVSETLWTIAKSITDDRLRELVDQQVSMGRVEPAELDRVLARVEGSRQRGLAAFRKAVSEVRPDSHSTAANELEVFLYRLLSQPGIPRVSRQQPFLLDERARVDAFVPDWSLVVEADGRNWHTRQQDFQRDRDRDNQLATRGILVVRFSYHDLTKRFDRCRSTLLATGRHRRAKTTA